MSRAADVHLYYQPTIASPHSHPQYHTITYCYWWVAVARTPSLALHQRSSARWKKG